MQDPSSFLVYKPLLSNTGIPDMNKLSICVTQFVNTERYDLTFLVQAAGAQYSGGLQKDTSLLIHKKCVCYLNVIYVLCRNADSSPKVNRAKVWKVPIVTEDWLFDCIKQWKCLPYDDYLQDFTHADGSSEEESETQQSGKRKAKHDSSVEPAAKKRKTEKKIFLFSGFTKEVELTKKHIKTLGGDIATEATKEWTHLLMPSPPTRTEKFFFGTMLYYACFLHFFSIGNRSVGSQTRIHYGKCKAGQIFE